jgi:hypothetical protein
MTKPSQEQIEVCFTTEEIEQVLKLKPKIYSNIKYKIWQKAQDEILDEWIDWLDKEPITLPENDYIIEHKLEELRKRKEKKE